MSSYSIALAVVEPLPPGTPPTVGQYRLGSLIARGGMGLVFHATDQRSGTPVAVKLMHAGLAASDPSFLERFENEAHVASLLRSPYTVQILDFGVQDGRSFLVMELIGGQSLSERLREGPLDVDDALRVASSVARALEEADARGIVHRDIKPDNILLDGEGRVKVTDFGVARALSSSGVTLPGSFVGTPLYAAPEQFEGEVDQRSDIYSVGITLFAMLTGHPPFEGKTPADTAIKHRLSPLPREALENIPEPAQNVVRRATEKDPRDRYQTASELAGALDRAREAIARRTPTPPRPVTPPPPRVEASSSGPLLPQRTAMATPPPPQHPQTPIAPTPQPPSEPEKAPIAPPASVRQPEETAVAPRRTDVRPGSRPVEPLRAAPPPAAAAAPSPAAQREPGAAGRRRVLPLAAAAGFLVLGGVAVAVLLVTSGDGDSSGAAVTTTAEGGGRSTVAPSPSAATPATAGTTPATATAPATTTTEVAATAPPVPPGAVRIPANVEGGTRTGVTARQGALITVAAQGRWCHSPMPIHCGNADGSEARIIGPPSYVPTAPDGSLIGRIGDGPWVPLASNTTWLAGQSGEIFLAMNDWPGSYADGNSGFLDVRVTVGAITP